MEKEMKDTKTADESSSGKIILNLIFLYNLKNFLIYL